MSVRASPSVSAWRAVTTGTAVAPVTRFARLAGSVADEVNAPDAPSWTTHVVGAERVDELPRLAVELLGEPGHQEQHGEHHRRAQDGRGEPTGAHLQVSRRQQEHPTQPEPPGRCRTSALRRPGHADITRRLSSRRLRSQPAREHRAHPICCVGGHLGALGEVEHSHAPCVDVEVDVGQTLLHHAVALPRRGDKGRPGHRGQETRRPGTAAAREERPGPRHRQAVVGPGAGSGRRGDVDRDDRSTRVPASHLPDRHVVEHPAVDQEVPLEGDGREHARDRRRRAERLHQRAAVMDLRSAVREVGGHAVERDPEVCDVERTEGLLHLSA